jgi:S-adenosylmethionine:tRNA-ribosyltransferase-isomerase (queuine synthetase)
MLTIVDDFDYGRIIQCDADIFELLEIYGQMPLPPYIDYKQQKESDYQPIIAQKP